jgi:2-amino-4-hydroxy-6-hydroxymethyldihydropteridine diphosphokinase
MLSKALELIEEQSGKIIEVSSVYQSAPWGFSDPINFLNQVICLETLLSPEDLLAKLLNTETSLGRTRHGKDYNSRLIDIDILFYDHQVIDQPHLIVPHPRLHQRRFTLVPLAEIAAGFVHPVIGLPIIELLKNCEDQNPVDLTIPKPVALKATAV